MKRISVMMVFFLMSCSMFKFTPASSAPEPGVPSGDREGPGVTCARAVVIEKGTTWVMGIYLEFSEPVSFPAGGGVFVYGITGNVTNGWNVHTSTPAEIMDMGFLDDGMALSMKVRLANNAWYYVEVATSVTDLSGNPFDGLQGISHCSEKADRRTGAVDGIKVRDIHRPDEDFSRTPAPYASLAFSVGSPAVSYVTLGANPRPRIGAIYVDGISVPAMLTHDGANISAFSVWGIGVRATANPVIKLDLVVPSNTPLKGTPEAILSENGREIPIEYWTDSGTWSQTPVAITYPGGSSIVFRPVEPLQAWKKYQIKFNSLQNLRDAYNIPFVDGCFDTGTVFSFYFVSWEPTVPRISTLVPDPWSVSILDNTLTIGFITPDGTSASPFGDGDSISEYYVGSSGDAIIKIKTVNAYRRLWDGRVVPQVKLSVDYSGSVTGLLLSRQTVDTAGNFLDTDADGLPDEEGVLDLGTFVALLTSPEYRAKMLNDVEREPDDTFDLAFPFVATDSGTEWRVTPEGDVDYVSVQVAGKGYLIIHAYSPLKLLQYANGVSLDSSTFTVELFKDTGFSLAVSTSHLVAGTAVTAPVDGTFHGVVSLECVGSACTVPYVMNVQVVQPEAGEPANNTSSGAFRIEVTDLESAVFVHSFTRTFSLPAPPTTYVSVLTGPSDVDWFYLTGGPGRYCIFVLDTEGVFSSPVDVNIEPFSYVYDEGDCSADVSKGIVGCRKVKLSLERTFYFYVTAPALNRNAFYELIVLYRGSDQCP